MFMPEHQFGRAVFKYGADPVRADAFDGPHATRLEVHMLEPIAQRRVADRIQDASTVVRKHDHMPGGGHDGLILIEHLLSCAAEYPRGKQMLELVNAESGRRTLNRRIDAGVDGLLPGFEDDGAGQIKGHIRPVGHKGLLGGENVAVKPVGPILGEKLLYRAGCHVRASRSYVVFM